MLDELVSRQQIGRQPSQRRRCLASKASARLLVLTNLVLRSYIVHPPFESRKFIPSLCHAPKKLKLLHRILREIPRTFHLGSLPTKHAVAAALNILVGKTCPSSHTALPPRVWRLPPTERNGNSSPVAVRAAAAVWGSLSVAVAFSKASTERLRGIHAASARSALAGNCDIQPIIPKDPLLRDGGVCKCKRAERVWGGVGQHLKSCCWVFRRRSAAVFFELRKPDATPVWVVCDRRTKSFVRRPTKFTRIKSGRTGDRRSPQSITRFRKIRISRKTGSNVTATSLRHPPVSERVQASFTSEITLGKMASAANKGTVKSVLSGDTIVVMGAPSNGPPPEKQLTLAGIMWYFFKPLNTCDDGCPPRVGRVAWCAPLIRAAIADQ